ncbi:MAG: insulinase family protein [Campylobacter sp.]|nr:insulinase family protein [Campylobacter sp.]
MIFPSYNQISLQNGLEVYHIPFNQGSAVISVNVFYKVGSRNETMGKSGIAHMLEHLNFKSTKTRKAGEFDEIVKGFGGVNNASTGFDYTHYYIKCEASNLDKSLELYADIMQNLALDESEFLPEREVVLEERRWRTDNSPGGYLFFRLFNTAFIYHPYHWTPIGFKDDIKNWNINDIKEFHAKFYQPKNAFLVICGDIDKDLAFKLSKKHFENIPNRGEIPAIHTVEPAQDGAKLVHLKKQSEVDIVALAYKTASFKSVDHNYLNALAFHLGGSKNSLISKKLIDELGLINDFEVFNLQATDENLFVIFLICNPKVDPNLVKAELDKLIAQIKADEISDDDLEKIKNSTKRDFIYSLDSASKVASLYGSYIARDGLDELFKIPQILENLTQKELLNTANLYFRDEKSTTIILKGDSHE